jgi:hypothetical protein
MVFAQDPFEQIRIAPNFALMKGVTLSPRRQSLDIFLNFHRPM